MSDVVEQTVTVTIHFPRALPGPAHTARMMALLEFVQAHDGQVIDADVQTKTNQEQRS